MTLKEWIEKKGLRQRDAASVLGIPESVVSRLIQGKNQPALATAMQIAKATKGAVKVEDWSQV